jgi:hypothetical protein
MRLGCVALSNKQFICLGVPVDHWLGVIYRENHKCRARCFAFFVMLSALWSATARAQALEAGRFDGKWRVTLVCPPPPDGARPFTYIITVDVKDAQLHGENGLTDHAGVTGRSHSIRRRGRAGRTWADRQFRLQSQSRQPGHLTATQWPPNSMASTHQSAGAFARLQFYLRKTVRGESKFPRYAPDVAGVSVPN